MDETTPASLSEEQERALWLRLREHGDDDARLSLIDYHLGLAHAIAARIFLHRPDDTVEFADYYQYAVVGLIESVDRYRADSGTAFATYASYRVRGAILNGIASASEAREQIAYRARVRKERLDSLARTDEIDADGLFEQMVELTTGLAIGYMLEDSGLVQEPDGAGADDAPSRYGNDQIKARLLRAIDELPERDKMIITYHYFHQISFEEISRMLNVSKGRVSQIHKRVLLAIRRRLGERVEIDSYY